VRRTKRQEGHSVLTFGPRFEDVPEFSVNLGHVTKVSIVPPPE
jgi:hypothetical protein